MSYTRYISTASAARGAKETNESIALAGNGRQQAGKRLGRMEEMTHTPTESSDEQGRGRRRSASCLRLPHNHGHSHGCRARTCGSSLGR